MSTHSIVDNMLGPNGLEAWKRLVQRFGLASAHANFRLMSGIPKPLKGNVEKIS